jgi:formylglycine-generating enzyme required for sulfatase activity
MMTRAVDDGKRSRVGIRRFAALAAIFLSPVGRIEGQIADAEFVVIKPGTFHMGSRLGDDHQRPVHAVTITRPFALQKTQVTQAQWRSVMDSNPSARRNCDRCPVERVSYDDVQRFIARINARSATKYRLPTEAEWEYAARAGDAGDLGDPASLTQGGFIADYAAGGTLPVGSQKANAWGVHDTEGNANSGNVWEWVNDWYGPLPSTAVTDPAGPESGDVRVLRGGAFQVSAAFPGATCRQTVLPSKTCVARVSFRLVKIE